MNLTSEEKQTCVHALEKFLEEVKTVESLPDQDVRMLAGEVKYEEFVEGIIKKLR